MVQQPASKGARPVAASANSFALPCNHPPVQRVAVTRLCTRFTNRHKDEGEDGVGVFFSSSYSATSIVLTLNYLFMSYV